MFSEAPVRRRKKANLFANDLRSLLYAYGDVADPYPESVAVLEDILQEYIVNMCHEAYRVAKTANRQKIKVDDFKFALRKDPRKLGRVEELLIMQKEIAEARKTFDNSEGKSLKNLDDQTNDNNQEDNEVDAKGSDGETAQSVADSVSGKKRKKEKKDKKDKKDKKERKKKKSELKSSVPQTPVEGVPS